MMHRVCVETFNNCYTLHKKPRIRKIFEKLGGKMGQTCQSSSFPFGWHCCAPNYLFFGSHSHQFLHFRLDSDATENLGSKLPFRPI